MVQIPARHKYLLHMALIPRGKLLYCYQANRKQIITVVKRLFGAKSCKVHDVEPEENYLGLVLEVPHRLSPDELIPFVQRASLEKILERCTQLSPKTLQFWYQRYWAKPYDPELHEQDTWEINTLVRHLFAKPHKQYQTGGC